MSTTDMDSDRDWPWSARTASNVHVNPRFAVRPHFNKDFHSNVNTAPHINPHFMQQSIFNSLEGAANGLESNSRVHYQYLNNYSVNTQYVTPMIHINPNIMQISNIVKQEAPVVEQTQRSNYILHSKNKIIRNNSPINSPVTIKAVPVVPSVPIVPKKPSYSLIRKTNVAPSTETEAKLCHTKANYKENNPGNNFKPLSNKYLMSSLHNRVWKRKSIGSTGEESGSGLSNISKRYSKHSLNRSSVSKINKRVIPTRRTLLKQKAQFVFIDGEKYSVNNNVLKKVTSVGLKIANECMSSKTKDIKTICISGVTYVRKSSDTFTIDNRKVNSMKKLKKMNMPCPVFRRYGKCPKNDIRKCALVHDRKHVTICSRFLKGTCKIDGCNLSHEVVLEKMPTCRFFLDGCCVRQSCPYLHVKLNDSAKVCSRFVQGYCVDGDQCSKKHINVCPDFYNTGECVRLMCPYPHKQIEERQPLTLSVYNSETPVLRISESSIVKPVGTESDFKQQHSSRYFENSSKVLPVADMDISMNNEESSQLLEAADGKESVHFVNRPKLGKLPSFISLE